MVHFPPSQTGRVFQGVSVRAHLAYRYANDRLTAATVVLPSAQGPVTPAHQPAYALILGLRPLPPGRIPARPWLRLDISQPVALVLEDSAIKSKPEQGWQ